MFELVLFSFDFFHYYYFAVVEGGECGIKGLLLGFVSNFYYILGVLL